MEKKDLTIGVARPGTVRPAGARPAGGGGKARVSARQEHGPFDLDAAASRLDRLLQQDAETGGGARADVPQRGYYFNVYV